MAVDWDSLTERERNRLYKRRRDLEDFLAAELMRFEKDTCLEVSNVIFGRESDHRRVIDERGERAGSDKNIWIQVQVPMRIYPE